MVAMEWLIVGSRGERAARRAELEGWALALVAVVNVVARALAMTTLLSRAVPVVVDDDGVHCWDGARVVC